MNRAAANATMPAERSSSLPGRATGLAAGVALFLWALLMNVTAGIGLADESWFVRVGQRLAQGDILYRDVSYGVTPLAAWIAGGSFALFGAESIVVKSLVALCFAASSVACLGCAAREGASRSALLLLAAALALFATPTLQSLYTPLAQLFFMISYALLLRHPTPHGAAALWIGIASGLCFACKQNFGALALAALLASICSRRPSTRELRGVGVILAAFAATVALVLLPVALQGAAGEFLDYALLSKGSYVRVGAIPYERGLSEFARHAAHATSWMEFRAAAREMPFILPFLVAIALPLRAIHDRLARGVSPPLTLAAFIVAGMLCAYPRFDLVHLSYTTPWILLGLTHAFSGLSVPALARPIRAAVLLLLSLLLGGELLQGTRRLLSAEYSFSTLPHLRGVLVERQQEAAILQTSSELAAAGAQSPIFLLSSNAGLYHLTSGLTNLTPYDYPFVTTFGLHGEADVRDALSDGRLGAVCLDPRIEPKMAPPLLLAFVRTRMTPDRDLGACTLYALRPGTAGDRLAGEPEQRSEGE